MRLATPTLTVWLITLGAVAAHGQSPAWIDIIADQSQVLVGRTLQARAYVHDSSGNILPNVTVTWSVNRTAEASITSQGLVTARGLATVRITARAGNVSGEAAIQCIPSKVEVTPGRTEVEVGTRTQFAVAAYDADGNVIPNVPFTWSLTNLRQGGSSLGRIDSTGTLSSTGEGGLWVWATYNYNETFPGLQQRWVSYAAVTSSVPKKYEMKRLYSVMSRMRKQWKLRPRQSMLWSTDDGQLYLNASLSGLANGLLNWDNGKWTVVTGGGVPHFGRSATATEFRSHSITRDGQILSHEDTSGNGAEINLGTRNGTEPLLSNNVPLGATEATNALLIGRNSLASTGQKIARATFRFVNETTTFTGLFRGTISTDELLICTKDTIEGVASPFTIDGDFGIASDGTAFYSITSGTNRVFYKHDYTGRTKLVAVGDSLPTINSGTSKVRSFLAGRTNSPAVWYDDDGTAIIGVLLEDNTQWYVMIAPDGTKSTLRLTGQSGILSRSPKQGVLIYANPAGGRGNGVYLWKDGTATLVVLLNTKLADQTVQEVESGTVNAAGHITLLVRGDVNALMAVRMDATPYVLFRDGETIDAELPVNLISLIAGAKTGPPSALAGGNGSSIATFAEGDWEPTLAIGERLFGNTMWFGGNANSIRKSPNGDFYFVAGNNLARVRPGAAPEAIQTFPFRPDSTLTVNAPGLIDINGNGEVAFTASTSLGDNRMYVWQNGQAKLLLVYSATAATAQTLDGRIASSIDQFALDATGRVIAQIRFRGVGTPFHYIWDGGSWTLATAVTTTKIGRHTVTGLNLVRASGSQLVASLAVDGIGNLLAEWTGAEWKVLVDIDTIMPNGQVANTVAGLGPDVNEKGEVLFQFANGANIPTVWKDGGFRQVFNSFRQTPDGDFLVRYVGMELRNDGTVYILAVNQFDELVLYEAVPVA